VHLVDRLGEIRLQIRLLRKEARSIVSRINAGVVGDTGSRFTTRTYQTTTTHPIAAPAPTAAPAAPTAWQVNPAQNQYQGLGDYQGLSGSMAADSRTFGQNGFDQGSFGVGRSVGVGSREG
jgi:hypothetical protein